MYETLSPEDVNEMLAREFPSAYEHGHRCVELADGVAVASWLFDDTKLRPGAYVAGPTLFGLADTALWFATFTKIGIEPMAVTSEMSIRFLRPAQNGDVLARAVINSVSRRRVAGTIEIWVGDHPDRLVALAQGSYARP